MNTIKYEIANPVSYLERSGCECSSTTSSALSLIKISILSFLNS